MAEPGTDRVDVDAGTQKMNGCCVSYRVWAYAFGCQRWDRLARQNPILRHETVYSKSGQWLFDLIEEDRVGTIPVGDQARQRGGRGRP